MSNPFNAVFFNAVFFAVLLSGQHANAQTDPKTEVLGIVNSLTTFTNTLQPEKVYLQTDRSIYAVGDTIYFKAYLFDATTLGIPPKSGILYLEMADEQNQVVKRVMVSIYIGLGWGNIAINEKDMPQGYYTLRAYTNWMRNLDEHYVFKKQLYIGAPGSQDMLIRSRFDVKQVADKQNAAINLKLAKVGDDFFRLKDYTLKITEGRKTWFKEKVETSIDGSIDFNFNIPDKADFNKLAITLQDLKPTDKSPLFKIPLILNRPEKIDLQFMPEGGSLYAGLDAHIAFKALSEDGNGTNVAGIIYNNKEEQVASFKSAHKGMGAFDLHIEPGEVYTARIKLPDGGLSKPYSLPVAKQSGVQLNIVNAFNSDSLQLSILATADMQANGNIYYLIGQARGAGCYGAVIHLSKQVNQLYISKANFPTGITRFTLLNAAKQPLSERMVYIDHGDNLRVNIAANKKIFTPRDSVGVSIFVTDKTGKPIQGSFSVSVTDDGQVKNDSLSSTTLLSAGLLTSDIKGYVEDPGYYFPQVTSAIIAQHLDNLLLTQDWVNYDWATVLGPPKSTVYLAEAAFIIHGKVANIFNKPIENSKIVLLSKKPSFVIDTLTNKQGIFTFKNIYPVDTAVYVIQARNKKGGSFNVGIDMDEFNPPVFNTSSRRIIPWYVNIDTARLSALKTHINYQAEQNKKLGIHMLNEVAIVDKKVIKDSKNLNGDGESDFALNEADLQKAGKVTLGDLLRQKIKGFQLGHGKTPYYYFINSQFMHLIIDGVDITPFFTYDGSGPTAFKEYVDTYLDYFTAEDIKGIEEMYSGKYIGTYWQKFLDPMQNPHDHAFIEVTTYAGKGPFLKKTPGVYLYKPLVFASKKQFYSPKYTSKAVDPFIDTRPTIYWAPNIITSSNGKANFSFYTADKPGTYTLQIEGSDMAGHIESTHGKIVIK